MYLAGSTFNVIFLVGRILVGGFFVFNAFHHFKNINMMAGFSRSKGVPAPKLAVGGSGILLLLGGLSLLLGFHPSIGALLLVIFLLGVSFTMHNFWASQDPQAKMGDMIHFMKNFAMIGFLLMTFAIPRPWPYSVGGQSSAPVAVQLR